MTARPSRPGAGRVGAETQLEPVSLPTPQPARPAPHASAPRTAHPALHPHVPEKSAAPSAPVSALTPSPVAPGAEAAAPAAPRGGAVWRLRTEHLHVCR